MRDRTATVTATGIARLAGVGRAAVSNWRRRHADFPAPVGGTAASPSFELAEIENWLSQHGKLVEATPEEAVRRQIERCAASSGIVDALSIAGIGMLCGDATAADFTATVRALGVDAPGSAEVLAPLLAPERSPEQRALVNAAAALVEHQAAAPAFESICDYFLRNHHKATDVALGSIVQTLIGIVSPTDSILDLTCGTGGVLTAVARSGAGVDCFGLDGDDSNVRLATVRLLLSGLSAPVGRVDVRQATGLLDDPNTDLRVHAVVGAPSAGVHHRGHEHTVYDSRWAFGGLPPRTEPELAWVQHALGRLVPGGVAALVMPPAVAARAAGRRIRVELVRSGALQAIVALPPGAMSTTSVGMHIWVLRHPLGASSATTVLLCDSAASTRARSADDVLARVVSTWREYSRDPGGFQVDGTCRVVPVIDLLDSEADLTPGRHMTGQRPYIELLEGLTGLASAVERLTRLIAMVRASSSEAAVRPSVTVGDLLRSGEVVLIRHPPGQSSEPGDLVTLTGHDVVVGQRPSGPAQAAESVQRVQKGDVLVPVIAKTVVARVATPEQVGAGLGRGVHVLRADTSVFDPWFLAGSISSAANVQRACRASSTVSGALRIDVKRLRVPVLSIEEQRTFGAGFRRLAELETLSARIGHDGENLAAELREALVMGTVEVVPDGHG